MLLSGWMPLFLTGCNVEDPIHETPHPEHGKITLTTDWTTRSTGINIPSNYTVKDRRSLSRSGSPIRYSQRSFRIQRRLLRNTRHIQHRQANTLYHQW